MLISTRGKEATFGFKTQTLKVQLCTVQIGQKWVKNTACDGENILVVFSFLFGGKNKLGLNPPYQNPKSMMGMSSGLKCAVKVHKREVFSLCGFVEHISSKNPE